MLPSPSNPWFHPRFATRRVPPQMIKYKTSHVTIRSWTSEQNDRLIALANSGVSAMRAAVALKRSIVATRNQARKLGVSFRSIKSLRASQALTQPDSKNDISVKPDRPASPENA